MNKIKESLRENIITKEILKMKIDKEIGQREAKRRNAYLKPMGLALATLLIMLVAGFYIFNSTNIFKDNKKKPVDNSKKEIFTSEMSNSANYSMTILLNLDNYLAKNNYISYNETSTVMLLTNNNDNTTTIDAKEIVDVEEFTKCNGTVVIEKDTHAYTYTIDAECSDDPAGTNNLKIKRYDGINNLGLNALHKLEPIDDGYIGLFDYSKTDAEKCKDNEYKCEYDGFAVAHLNNNGDINNLKGITRSDLNYGYEKTIQIEDFFVLNNTYYVSYSVRGNESYKEVPFKDEVSNWIAKFDLNLNLVWNKEMNEVGGIVRTMKVGNTLGLVQSYYKENLKIHLINDATGSIKEVIEFDKEANTYIFYANNNFYHVDERRFCNPDCETQSITLNKFDNSGKTVFSKDMLSNLNDSEYFPMNEVQSVERRAYANNENIFIYNSYNPHRAPYISVFNQNGEFIINHTTLNNYDRIVYEYDNQYSLIRGSKDLKFTVNTFDKTGNLIKEDYYEAYNGEEYYKKEYLATSNGLICFSSSYNNNGTLLLLYFD